MDKNVNTNVKVQMFNLLEQKNITIMTETNVKAVTEANGTQLLGLTVLTHYTDEDCQRMYGRDVAGSVKMLADIGQEAGVDGLVLPGTTLHVVKDMNVLKSTPFKTS